MKCVESFTLAGTNDAMVNLANLYDEIGRPLEAITTFEKVLKRAPDFGMATANKAQAVENLVSITEYQAAYLVYAYQLYNNAFKYEKSILEHGGTYALHNFKAHRDHIAKYLQDNSKEDWLERDLAHDAFKSSDRPKDEASYIEFCLQNDLYLNLK
jgi:tetratricopeptide (TPR) repeat protein